MVLWRSLEIHNLVWIQNTTTSTLWLFRAKEHTLLRLVKWLVFGGSVKNLWGHPELPTSHKSQAIQVSPMWVCWKSDGNYNGRRLLPAKSPAVAKVTWNQWNVPGGVQIWKIQCGGFVQDTGAWSRVGFVRSIFTVDFVLTKSKVKYEYTYIPVTNQQLSMQYRMQR